MAGKVQVLLEDDLSHQDMMLLFANPWIKLEHVHQSGFLRIATIVVPDKEEKHWIDFYTGQRGVAGAKEKEEYGKVSRLGTAPRSNRDEAKALEGSTPSPSAFGNVAGLVQRHDSWLPTRRPGFESPIPLRLGNRLTGRLPDFESGDGGSSPPSRNPGQLLVVVTPRSERGGRWFDSSPRNSESIPEVGGRGSCRAAHAGRPSRKPSGRIRGLS